MISSNVDVLEPAESYDLCTLEQVKAYLQITSTTDDPRLQLLITFGSQVISDLCGRVFGLEKVTETIMFEPPDEPYTAIPLSRYPIVSIESVLSDDVELADYRYESSSGLLRGTFGSEVEVTYTGGYELPDKAPGPLALASMDLMKQTYYYGSRDPMIWTITDNQSGSVRYFPPPGVSVRGGSTGGGGVGGARTLPLSGQATALIAPYRRLALV